MKRWRWISLGVVYAIHDRQLAEHGGLDGIRDEGAVESGIERPRNLAKYDDSADAAALAACYLFGVARNHGFADGNKRTAWVVTRLFLAENGYSISFDPVDAVKLVESVAAGALKESEIADWFKARIRRASRK
jgi:death-on-curing protein